MKHLQHTSKTTETFEIHACNMLLLAAALRAASSGMSTRAAALGGQIVAEETITAVPALLGG
jgi:hypothetical protein